MPSDRGDRAVELGVMRERASDSVLVRWDGPQDAEREEQLVRFWSDQLGLRFAGHRLLPLAPRGRVPRPGRPVDAARAWEHAEDSYQATDLDSDRNWVRLWLSRDCFESVRAVIYSATGHPDEAVLTSARVITRLAGASGKADAIALINAATAMATAGQVSQAAEAGRHALHAVRVSEASGCLPRAHSLEALLNHQRDRHPAVRSYAEDLAATQQRLDALSVTVPLTQRTFS